MIRSWSQLVSLFLDTCCLNFDWQLDLQRYSAKCFEMWGDFIVHSTLSKDASSDTVISQSSPHSLTKGWKDLVHTNSFVIGGGGDVNVDIRSVKALLTPACERPQDATTTSRTHRKIHKSAVAKPFYHFQDVFQSSGETASAGWLVTSILKI
jgi:hypothetical protein